MVNRSINIPFNRGIHKDTTMVDSYSEYIRRIPCNKEITIKGSVIKYKILRTLLG
ncbi:hypothetical protein Hanom_Chr00s000907g01670041 [Helianthus anomalus]